MEIVKSLFFGPEKPMQCYRIVGRENCDFHEHAVKHGRRIEEISKQKVQVEVTQTTEDDWKKTLEAIKREHPDAQNHRTSPVIFEGCDKQTMRFIGGFTQFVALTSKRADH